MSAVEVPISFFHEEQPQWWKNFGHDNPKISRMQLKEDYGIVVSNARPKCPYSLIFASYEEYIKFIIEWS